MLLIDRYIFTRFAVNFATLFSLVFIFVVAVDVILNVDEFVDAARKSAGEHAGVAPFVISFLTVTFDFQAPRVFQFYAYLHGMVAIGAMGFTLAQMHRYRELVAVMASGVSLRRVAMPFIIAVFGLGILQLLNQELMLPKVAPLLLRGYGDIGQRGVNNFPVKFSPDSEGSLLQSPSFNPQTQILIAPTILQRDEKGRTHRRITASQAVWSEHDKAWKLTDGRMIRLSGDDSTASAEGAGGGGGGGSGAGGVKGGAVLLSEIVDAFPTDLTPHVLLVRRYNEFAAMLSLKQIRQMLDTPHVGETDSSRRDTLMRYVYSRLSSVLVNLLVLGLSLPCFLLREPANLLRQSVICAGLTIPATVGSALGMMIALPGIPPAVGVFLPVIILVFMAMFPWTFFKT